MSETESVKGFKIETSTLRAYTMIAALALIWIFFYWATGGIFLTPRNLSNLTMQTAVTGVLAVGMLMVIVAGQIDLSVGSVLGLAGACAALAMTNQEFELMGVFFIIRFVLFLVIFWVIKTFLLGRWWQNLLLGIVGLGIVLFAPMLVVFPVAQIMSFLPAILIAIVLAIAIGSAIGLFHGTLTAYANIPAFIVTLGGLLAWRGAVKGLTKSETIPVADDIFKAIGQNYIPKNIGWILAGLAVVFILVRTLFKILELVNSLKESGSRINISLILQITVSPIVQLLAVIAFIVIMNLNEGIPISVLILLTIALLGVFITNFTTFGRYLYAIGGNPDAARLSGINNKAKILQVYALLGALTGIAALIFTARVGSAAPDAGVLKELDAIAACVIGGASLMGGRGTIFGAIIGALFMASLDNGMSLLNVRDYLQDIIKGSILVTAVGLDMLGRKRS